jgi:hypothetical protein
VEWGLWISESIDYQYIPKSAILIPHSVMYNNEKVSSSLKPYPFHRIKFGFVLSSRFYIYKVAKETFKNKNNIC